MSMDRPTTPFRELTLRELYLEMTRLVAEMEQAFETMDGEEEDPPA